MTGYPAPGQRLSARDARLPGIAAAAQADAFQAQPAPPSDLCEASEWVFIVGAPRCGTTSLSGYLSSRPDVCFSTVKEPHFFSGNDLRQLSDEGLRRKVRDDYLLRYFARTGSPQVMAEGSVTYLYAPEQLEPILRLWPKAKFIVGVRNPLTLAPSLHQRLCYNGDETVRDFARAWALVPERRLGRSIPRSCAHARWLDYWEAGMLGKYVEKMFEVVGRERTFVYLFDEFIADPAKVYRGVLEFLQLPDDGRCEYPTHRPSRDYKIGWLQRALKRPPRVLAKLGGERYHRLIAAGAGLESDGLSRALWAARDRILAWNRAPAPRVQIAPRLRSEMAAMYADDVARLGTLLDRDLGHWLDEQAQPRTQVFTAMPVHSRARRRRAKVSGLQPAETAE